MEMVQWLHLRPQEIISGSDVQVCQIRIVLSKELNLLYYVDEKIAKLMNAGGALVLHGLDKLIYLKATPPWAVALTGCFGLTLMSG